MKNLLIIVALYFISGCSGQHLDIFPPLSNQSLMSEKIAVDKLREDVDALYQGVRARHPALMDYANIANLELQVDKIKSEITQPMTRLEFYRMVGQLSHHFNDGHSFLIWPYQELNALTEKGNTLFPFNVEINSDGLFVKSDYVYGDQNIVAGSEILKINGVPASTLIDNAQRYVGGETRQLREQFVAARFPQMLWSIYGGVNQFEMELAVAGNTVSIVVSEPDLIVQSQGSQISNNDFYYKLLDNQVGYLYVGHFDVEPDWFEDFIDQTFVTINSQNVSNLIIDIRDNTGGNTDTATYLSRYVADKPFQLVSGVKEKLNADNRGWFNYRGEEGEILNLVWDEWQTPIDKNLRFNGQTYLLVSQVSYSSAIVFATTLQDNGFATLVGQTTGGFANQTAQGNLFNLPNSELRAYVATKLLVRPSGDLTTQGVVPHITTPHNKQSIQSGIDTEIEKVMSLIEG